MRYFELLVDSRHGGDVLQTRGDSSYLILPAATSGHDLFHCKYMCIKIFLCVFDSHEFKYCFHAGCGKNGGSTKTGTFRNVCHFGMHLEAAAKTIQHFFQAASFFWNDSAGKEAGFLQCERIERVSCSLKRFDGIKFSMDIHVTAVKDNLFLADLFQCNFYRLLTIEKNCQI